MIDPDELFCLDSTVFINSWRKHYPIDVFPSVWESIDDLSNSGFIISPYEVYNEIKEKDDDLFEWVKARKHIFERADEEIILALKKVMRKHGRLVDTKKGRSKADPWVIAHAQVSGATIVTDEQKRINVGRSPKIPDVCEDLDIPYMTTIQFLRKIELNL